MKFIFLAVALILVVAAVIALLINKKALVTHRTESTLVKFNVTDFPQHGISLVVPPNASSYSVFLKNTNTRSVVGYSLRWECFDGRGDVANRNLSNDRQRTHIASWVFLHGDQSDRTALLKRSNEVIKPNSTWLLSFDSEPRLVEEAGGMDAGGTTSTESQAILKNCANVKVIADGIFFDDGTFVGPDSTGFFNTVKTQLEARYEVMQEVHSKLKSGQKPDEIFRELEREREGEAVRLGGNPTTEELHSYFRKMFASDVLGKKEVLGTEKTIQDIRLRMSKPWVKLRKQ